MIGSAKKRSTAARVLVERVVRAWKYRYPCAKIDDCAVVCLFLKRQQGPMLSKSLSESTELSLNYSASTKTDDGMDTVLNYKVKKDRSEDWR